LGKRGGGCTGKNVGKGRKRSGFLTGLSAPRTLCGKKNSNPKRQTNPVRNGITAKKTKPPASTETMGPKEYWGGGGGERPAALQRSDGNGGRFKVGAENCVKTSWGANWWNGPTRRGKKKAYLFRVIVKGMKSRRAPGGCIAQELAPSRSNG